MSKISYYPSADEPLQLSDRLIGTEAPRPTPSATPLATKNFSLGELLDLFSSNFPAASLQAVLNTGNTATQNITLTGTITSTVMKPTNIEDTSGSQGTTFQILSKGASSINWINIPVDNLQAVLNAGSVATGNISLTGNITSTRIIPGNIQDDIGGIGTVGQVLSKTSTGIRWITNPASYTAGLADVLSIGNTATNDINLIGNVTATLFIKSGGTSLQYLMADGSVSTGPSLTGFVPYTGATANVNLGEYELKAGQVTLDTSPTGAAAVATTRWNDSIGTSETTLKGGSVVLKNGVDLVARVVNKVTPNATLTKAAYEAVRISGAQGQRLAVAYAQANNDNNSADTIGIVCETIATNQEGFILTVGQLEEINTTGSLQGETWADGDVLYLSPTTAGRLTNIKPTGATGHIVVMGYVEYAHAVHGKIYVKIMNGWELDELHNVFINSPANNEGLFYDSADSLWKNETIASALGYTPFQLPSLTSGSVLFSNGTTIAQDNANLFWDDTNNRLGIGTASPTSKLDIITIDTGYSTIAKAVTGQLRIRPWLSANYGAVIDSYNLAGTAQERLTLSASKIQLLDGNCLINTTTDAGFKLDVNGTARVVGRITGNESLYLGTGGATSNQIVINGTGANAGIYSPSYSSGTTNIIAFKDYSGSEKMRLTATGNVLINTTTDAGYRLDVNGTARFGTSGARTELGDFSGGGQSYGLLKADFASGWAFGISNLAKSQVYFEIRSTGQTIFGSGNNNYLSLSSSAKVQIDSTTQGFLPPRMTTTQKNAIATPAAGLVVYDTDLKQLCTYNGTWGNSPFYQQSLAGVKYFTDFDNTASTTPNFAVFASGLGADTRRTVVNIPNQTANQIGFSQFQTGTTSTGYATMINEGFVGKQFVFGGGAWVFETFVNVETLSDVTNRFRFMAGFGDSPTNASEGNGVLFTYDEGGIQNGTIASPNWQCVTSASSVRTLTTTSTTVSANTWTKLRIEVNAAGTSVTFYINGTLVATHTTNIPTFISAANARAFNVKLSILKSTGTTNRSVFCDYLLYENNLTTLR